MQRKIGNMHRSGRYMPKAGFHASICNNEVSVIYIRNRFHIYLIINILNLSNMMDSSLEVGKSCVTSISAGDGGATSEQCDKSIRSITATEWK